VLDKVQINMTYRNIKNKQLYMVTGIGFHTENEEITVRYKPLYPSEYAEYYRPLEGPKGFKQKFTR
jgi:DUF1680 family protein